MFFFSTSKVIIATPDSMGKSNYTVDMSPEQLSHNYDIQSAAEMATAALIRPHSWYAAPTPERERLKSMARYLSGFQSDKNERDNVYRYISDNKPLRILFLDR